MRPTLDPARDPVVRRHSKDVQPLPSFAEAATTVLRYLHATYGFGQWMVTRAAGADWVVLRSVGDGYPVHDGDVLAWSDTFCSRMVRGEGPRVAPRLQEVPAYAQAPLNSLVTVNGYLGVPLTGPGGELFGTLCAVDAEPFDDAVVAAQPLFELQARLLSSLLSVELLAAAQSRRAESAERSACDDALTGVLNRRGWDQAVAAEQVRSRRHASPVSVLAIDLDGLKGVNDSQGHAAGDALLARAGQVLLGAVRDGDVVARTGGDEFALMFPGLPEAAAQARATHVQELLQHAGVSASCGVSAIDPREGSLSAAWARADAAMYRDKSSRRPTALAG